MKIKITASTRPDRDRIDEFIINKKNFYIELNEDEIIDSGSRNYTFVKNKESKDGNYYDDNGDLVITYQDLGKEVLNQIFEHLHNVPGAYRLKYQIDLEYDREDSSPSRWIKITVWDMYTSHVRARSGNEYADVW